MIVAIMIGRKGSSGFPGKNTTEVLGHPMAWWPLEVARQVPAIDVVYVSTDDPTISQIAVAAGARTIERPASLASKAALSDDAYHHAHEVVTSELARDGRVPELYVLLMANAVTITPELISEGIEVMQARGDLDSAISVSCYNMWSPLRARTITDEGLLEPFVPFETFGDPATLNCDRDSQGDVWFADAGVSIVRPGNFDHLPEGMLPTRSMGRRIYPLRNRAGLDVDYDYQLPQARWWLEQRAGGGRAAD